MRKSIIKLVYITKKTLFLRTDLRKKSGITYRFYLQSVRNLGLKNEFMIKILIFTYLFFAKQVL